MCFLRSCLEIPVLAISWWLSVLFLFQQTAIDWLRHEVHVWNDNFQVVLMVSDGRSIPSYCILLDWLSFIQEVTAQCEHKYSTESPFSMPSSVADLDLPQFVQHAALYHSFPFHFRVLMGCKTLPNQSTLSNFPKSWHGEDQVIQPSNILGRYTKMPWLGKTHPITPGPWPGSVSVKKRVLGIVWIPNVQQPHWNGWPGLWNTCTSKNP